MHVRKIRIWQLQTDTVEMIVRILLRAPAFTGAAWGKNVIRLIKIKVVGRDIAQSSDTNDPRSRHEIINVSQKLAR